ncbi:MAG: Transcriptional regulator, ArsR family [Nevskia sp.]|nr:Transcriptional regulator, ArsR family [Nevskia sp.]
MARPFQHPSAKDLTIDGVLYALSDPVRRGIVAKLIDCNGMSCSQACEDLPASTVSFHHKILRDTGLIRSEKRGVEVINIVRKAELEKRFPGLLAAILSNHKSPSKSPGSNK